MESLTLYNTLTKKKEPFAAEREGSVTMYNCGPTVYSFAHIGNLASYLFADFLRRYLEYSGYRVRQIKNITDVGHLTANDSESGEDKMAAAALREKKDPYAVADYYTAAYLADEQKLNIAEPEVRPRATGHIADMIAMIETLIKKGFAYAHDGEVYFDISTFPAYGNLSGNTLAKLKEGARVEINPNKKSPFDFTLWRKAAPNHLMQWDSPWGKGYPGWHIECSAMSIKYLDAPIDIHTGGEDNIFPHHESEIAQSEAATGTPFVRFWIHRRHLLVNGKKMAKSAGNFFTLRNLEEQGYSPLAFRLLVFSSHYRSQLNFTDDAMKEAMSDVEYLKKTYWAIARTASTSAASKTNIDTRAEQVKNEFVVAMNDDFDTHRALETLKKYLHGLQSAHSFTAREREIILSFLDSTSTIILGKPLKELLAVSSEEWNEIEALLTKRETYRKTGKWEEADRVRAEIESKGFIVRDRKDGPAEARKR